MKDILSDLLGRNPTVASPEDLLNHGTRVAVSEIVFHAMSLGRTDLAVAVTSRVCSLLAQQGQHREGLRLARGLLALSPPDGLARTQALVAMSDLLLKFDPSQSRELMDMARSIEPDDPWIRIRRAQVLVDLEEYQEAQQVFEVALAHARTDGDLVLEARLLDELGIIAQHRGSYDRAVALHLEALDILLTQHSSIDICVCYLALARAELYRQAFVDAADYASKAYEYAQASRLYGMAAEASLAALEALDKGGRRAEAVAFAVRVLDADAREWPTNERDVAYCLGHARAFLATARYANAEHAYDLRATASDALGASELFRAAGNQPLASEWGAFAARLASQIAALVGGEAEG